MGAPFIRIAVFSPTPRLFTLLVESLECIAFRGSAELTT
jgi:hypothetical protein